MRAVDIQNAKTRSTLPSRLVDWDSVGTRSSETAPDPLASMSVSLPQDTLATAAHDEPCGHRVNCDSIEDASLPHTAPSLTPEIRPYHSATPHGQAGAQPATAVTPAIVPACSGLSHFLCTGPVPTRHRIQAKTGHPPHPSGPPSTTPRLPLPVSSTTSRRRVRLNDRNRLPPPAPNRAAQLRGASQRHTHALTGGGYGTSLSLRPAHLTPLQRLAHRRPPAHPLVSSSPVTSSPTWSASCLDRRRRGLHSGSRAIVCRGRGRGGRRRGGLGSRLLGLRRRGVCRLGRLVRGGRPVPRRALGRRRRIPRRNFHSDDVPEPVDKADGSGGHSGYLQEVRKHTLAAVWARLQGTSMIGSHRRHRKLSSSKGSSNCSDVLRAQIGRVHGREALQETVAVEQSAAVCLFRASSKQTCLH